MTEEVRNMREQFTRKTQRAAEAIDEALATESPTPPIAFKPEQISALAKMASEISDVAGVVRRKIENALRNSGSATKGVHS